MKLFELAPAPGAKKSPKRVGRGLGSGLGKTSAKGHKGQKARSGGVKGPAFEGGQTPLQRRLPKRGFTNKFRHEWVVVALDKLNRFDNDTEITPELLVKTGIIKQIGDGVKILGNGDIKKKLIVKSNSFSKTAVEKIEKIGGKAEVI
jgi:large subunit ribosomal protein L15